MEIKIKTDELLSVIETAKELGKPRWTIYRWVDDNKLIGVRLGGVLFIPTSEVARMKGEMEKEAVSALPLKESST